MTDADARMVVAVLTSAPVLISGLATLVTNIGTLIVVLRGRREIREVKKIVDSRTDQLLVALEQKGEYHGMVKALGADEKANKP